MPRKAAGLTAAGVRHAKPGRYGDGNGLYLLVRDNGTRFWLFRYILNRRMREMGLGKAGDGKGAVVLATAREKAAALRQLVRAGVDPLAQRDAAEAAAVTAARPPEHGCNSWPRPHLLRQKAGLKFAWCSDIPRPPIACAIWGLGWRMNEIR